MISSVHSDVIVFILLGEVGCGNPYVNMGDNGTMSVSSFKGVYISYVNVKDQ